MFSVKLQGATTLSTVPCDPHFKLYIYGHETPKYSVSTCNVNTVSTTRTYTCSTMTLLVMLTQYLQPAHKRAVQCLYLQCKHSTCNPHIHVQWGGGQWRKMAKNGEKWRKMAMANSAFSFVKFAIFRQFLILEFHI